MGCDIHFYVEQRVDGIWQSADAWEPDEYASGGHSVPHKKAFYDGRNYELFAMLAGVRNRFDIVPISEPKGFPDDCSPQVAALDIDHSASWLTLGEILAYDWLQTVQMSGVVVPTAWASWREEHSAPNMYSQGVDGWNTRMLDEAEFERAWVTLREFNGYPSVREPSSHLYRDQPELVQFVALLGGGSPYCTVVWDVPYHRAASEFWSETMPRLLALGKPEDVRCVFFFDN